MGIGNNTYWIIIAISTSNGWPQDQAVLNPDDKRRSLQFQTQNAAETYIQQYLDAHPSTTIHWPIEVRA